MKTLALSLLGIVALAISATAQAIPGRTLLWADEFAQADGTKPDSAKWGYDTGATGWGNNELQNYTDRTENARIEGGNLVIEARKETPGENNFTSARLLTRGKASWTYGRIEARIKIPKGQGIWPAFWMLGTNIGSVGWPLCGEIDIMENIGSLPSTLYGTIHGPGYSGGGGISGNTVLAGAALGDDFHVYAIEWEENRIRWFLDGQLFFTLTPANLPAGSAWVFNAPQFLILNVAVGGNWPGYPTASTVFPQRMTVDYVRVYAPVSSVSAPSGNQLQNPGFETGSLGGWTGVGANVAVETAIFRSGTRALKVFGQFSGVANDSGAYQQLPATAGEEYAANAWLFTPAADKIAGANSAWVEVTFRDAAGAVLALHRSAAMTSASTAGAWQDFAVSQQLNPATGAVISTNARLLAPAGTASVRKQVVFRQPATAAGAVWFDDSDLSKLPPVEPVTQPVVTVDPAENWLGYMNVSDLPASGGAFRSGGSWNVPDLRASFSGTTLTLSPNTINDTSTYWYVGGGGPGRPGNKIMSANMYVEKTGSLSGKTVTFTGTVSAHTFTSAHRAVAFIKDFAPDYSSFTTTTVPLADGTFSISHTTAPGSGRHVQYGFETTGVNVWSTDVGPFGSVKISPFTPTPFSNWFAGFDVSSLSAADRSATGDPDRDGRSNFLEFALNEHPRSAAISGKVRSRLETVGGSPAMVITLPVRGNPVFSGAPWKSATTDQAVYRIEGSNGLAVFDQIVTEIPASTTGMPALDAGWAYRSFRLHGPVGGASSRGPAGFLRVGVVPVP
jgi:beta-glucanase (GH16 family)